MPAANGTLSSSSSSACPAPASYNDTSAQEPAPDIINELLTSLSNISLPNDPNQYSPLIPQRSTSKAPTRSSRAASAQRYNPPTSIFSREASSAPFHKVDNAQEPSPIGKISLNVAESPTIKTSRPPSGYSRLTSPKTSRKGKPSHNLRGAFAPPSSPDRPLALARQRTEPILPRLTEEPLFFNKPKKSLDDFRRPPALSLKSRRDSLQVTRSREAKGKQRAGPPSPLYSPLPPQQPLRPRSPYSRIHGPLLQRPYQSERTSPKPSPTSSLKGIDDRRMPQTASKSLSGETSSESFVIIHHKSAEASQSRSERRRFIPSRSSSVGRTSAPSPRFGRGSRRSSLLSQRQSPETVKEERQEDDISTPKAEDQSEGQDLGLGEENNVVKRIKQLKAAKQEREKSELSKDDASPPNVDPDSAKLHSASPDVGRPDTSSAPKQLEEAVTLKQHEVIVKPQSASTSAELPSATTFNSESPVLMSGEYANFSRPKPTLIDGDNAAVPKPSIHVNGSPTRQSLGLSRSSSRTKRWSNPDLKSRKSSMTHHRRSGSDKLEKTTMIQQPLVEERRANDDCINESVEEFLTSPRLSQRIQSRKESRVISFSEVGDSNGHAVFCCIGMGLTRYVMAFYEELAVSLKLRLITPERPGVGDSDPYDEPHVPLHWPDDVRAICSHLSIQSFSLIAHSAGAIYALATALKMPSRVRGRLHLLAPWIPPSQLNTPPIVSAIAGSPTRSGGLPKSQRFLRYVPTSFLKLGSASYLTGASKPSVTKPSTLRKGARAGGESMPASVLSSPRPSMSSRALSNAPSTTTVPLSSSRTSLDPRTSALPKAPSTTYLDDILSVPSDHSMTAAVLSAGRAANSTPPGPSSLRQETPSADTTVWQKQYDTRLTALTWELATRKGNPTADLIICLERNGAIGFMYRDVAREVVIHHGSKDSRVPLENIKWLGTQVLQKCELRVLEGEGHGLMANAGVMAGVLGEVAKEAGMGADYGNLGDSSSYKSPLLEGEATF